MQTTMDAETKDIRRAFRASGCGEVMIYQKRHILLLGNAKHCERMTKGPKVICKEPFV